MARGRFISNAIMSDKTVNELSDDTSRLAFTWLITAADVEGRVHGDPAMVRSLLFPRRTDVSIDQIEAYISEWADTGLVVWYECAGDKWLWFPNFEKHQVGLRKDREPESIIPPYESGTTPEVIRQPSGKMRGKLREDKLSRSKGNRASRKDKQTELIQWLEEQPQAVKVFVDKGGQFATGALKDGTPKRENAAREIAETVGNDQSKLDLWGKIVFEYQKQWSPKSYTVMLNEYFLKCRVPGGKQINDHQPSPQTTDEHTAALARAYR